MNTIKTAFGSKRKNNICNYLKLINVLSAVIICMCLMFFMGCSDQKTASEKNFSRVIGEKLHDSLVVSLPVLARDKYIAIKGDNSIDKDDVLIMVDLKGYYEDTKRFELLLSDLSNEGIASLKCTDFANQYNIYLIKTAKLTHYYRIHRAQNINRNMIAIVDDFVNDDTNYIDIYLGKIMLDKVVEWEELNPNKELKVVKVKYIDKIVDAPSWSKSMNEYFKENKDIGVPKYLGLICGDNGWSLSGK
jgi:hypothetical protein